MDELESWLRSLDPRAVDWQELGARLGAEPAAWPLIAGGAALIFFGRRLYWLALGGLGAAVAVILAAHLELPTPEGRLIVAVLAAVAGALVAVFAQRLVVSAIGFLTGVAAGAWATPLVWPDSGLWLLLIVFFTGLIGLLIAGRLFEGLLIVATSAAGAWLVVEALPQLGPQRVLVFAVLVIVGVVAQTRRGSRGGKKRESKPEQEP